MSTNQIYCEFVPAKLIGQQKGLPLLVMWYLVTNDVRFIRQGILKEGFI